MYQPQTKPGKQPVRAQLLLARIFQQTRYQALQYRSHKICGVRGGTNRENLDKWFSEVGANLTAADRLFIYVTAHGGRASDKKKPLNTGLYLWNSECCQMREFTGFLEKLPADVPVVLLSYRRLFNEHHQFQGDLLGAPRSETEATRPG